MRGKAREVGSPPRQIPLGAPQPRAVNGHPSTPAHVPSLPTLRGGVAHAGHFSHAPGRPRDRQCRSYVTRSPRTGRAHPRPPRRRQTRAPSSPPDQGGRPVGGDPLLRVGERSQAPATRSASTISSTTSGTPPRTTQRALVTTVNASPAEPGRAAAPDPKAESRWAPLRVQRLLQAPALNPGCGLPCRPGTHCFVALFSRFCPLDAGGAVDTLGTNCFRGVDRDLPRVVRSAPLRWRRWRQPPSCTAPPAGRRQSCRASC